MTQRTTPAGVTRRDFLSASALTIGAAACKPGKDPATPAAASANGGGVFPSHFVWGAATASYQVEGAAHEDGRGASVWDVFCKKKGAVYEGHTGDVACDHYHRFKEDIALMKTLGIQSYRFSVAWPRVLPDGVGRVNQSGLDFYKRLVDELLKNSIEPLCTVFHWDYPQALYERGGWLNRDSADWLGEYTAVVAKHLGDRVRNWVTQNEPQCYIGIALLEGLHAPGEKLKFDEYLVAAHNSLRAHGKSVQAIRAAVKGAKIGYVNAARVMRPATDRPEDLDAARTAIFAVDRSQWNNAWWTDPVVFGRYPQDGIDLYGKDMPKFPARDLDEIKQPIDFLGLNIYTADSYKRGPDGKPERIPFPPGYPRSGVDWQPIVPSCLYWGARFFHERYKLPVSITENGLSTRDQVFLDGKVHDVQRVDYMHRVLIELSRAIDEGVPVTGYYAWSLLDNFEWADGYKQRFGLVFVDFASQKRLPKDSFDWYKKVIATNGRSLLDRGTMPVSQVTA